MVQRARAGQLEVLREASQRGAAGISHNPARDAVPRGRCLGPEGETLKNKEEKDTCDQNQPEGERVEKSDDMEATDKSQTERRTSQKVTKIEKKVAMQQAPRLACADDPRMVALRARIQAKEQATAKSDKMRTADMSKLEPDLPEGERAVKAAET